MFLENLVINISLTFICNFSLQKLLFLDDCDLKNVSVFSFVLKNRAGVHIKNEVGREYRNISCIKLIFAEHFSAASFFLLMT